MGASGELVGWCLGDLESGAAWFLWCHGFKVMQGIAPPWPVGACKVSATTQPRCAREPGPQFDWRRGAFFTWIDWPRRSQRASDQGALASRETGSEAARRQGAMGP